jgi:hypothetical protein
MPGRRISRASCYGAFKCPLAPAHAASPRIGISKVSCHSPAALPVALSFGGCMCRQVCAEAGVDPSEVCYVEAHGTGTVRVPTCCCACCALDALVFGLR